MCGSEREARNSWPESVLVSLFLIFLEINMASNGSEDMKPLLMDACQCKMLNYPTSYRCFIMIGFISSLLSLFSSFLGSSNSSFDIMRVFFFTVLPSLILANEGNVFILHRSAFIYMLILASYGLTVGCWFYLMLPKVK